MIDAGHDKDSYWERPPNLNGLTTSQILDLSDQAFLQYMTTSRAFRETIYGVSAGRAMAYPTSFGNARALDFGCGVGYDAVSLAELGWRVTLVDLHAKNRQVAARWLTALEFGHGACSAISDDEQFSLVLSYGVLHHIVDVEPVIRQLQAVVAPGGVLSLMLYTRSFVPRMDERSDGKREGPYTRGYDLGEIQDLLGPEWTIWRTETWNKDKYRAISASRVGEEPAR